MDRINHVKLVMPRARGGRPLPARGPRAAGGLAALLRQARPRAPARAGAPRHVGERERGRRGDDGSGGFITGSTESRQFQILRGPKPQNLERRRRHPPHRTRAPALQGARHPLLGRAARGLEREGRHPRLLRRGRRDPVRGDAGGGEGLKSSRKSCLERPEDRSVGMDFSGDLAAIQRQLARSADMASRRARVLEALGAAPGERIAELGCAAASRCARSRWRSARRGSRSAST